MAYIGKQPVVGNFQVCDAISVVNGQAAYTMQVASANVEPENANHMLVSLNGVLQKPGSSFTISGATITFASNLATGDVIDFIILLGDTLNIGTPSDATVTTAKLANSAVDLTSKVTGALPVANGGTNLTSGFANGITMADQWRITATTNDASDADVTSNWERVDTAGAGFIGSAMTESSGVFTFPSTGMYLVTTSWYIIASSDGSATIRTQVTQNNSSYVDAAIANAHSSGNSTCPSNYIVDVTDTSNVKVKFRTTSFSSGTSIYGDTSITYTGVWFIRLGDT